ncbi:uncharacterized protein LOC117292171 [Asterias rubens]|uniref:uncharacterized protein LOC117292171 n=1 Tax=Asterias rubens TaxID=7604 RepID=UPI0014550ABC|nr:uncharacterized protein LOC117292171 [Asterias rubens]
MDVKPGHCWRCEKALPDCVVRCDRCNKAVYCSNLCQKRDLVRHGAVECQIFGPKTCTYCKKEGDHKQCAGCSAAWYCNVSCQRKDHSNHKLYCKTIKICIQTAVAPLNQLYNVRAQDYANNSQDAIWRAELPKYFGNKMACDFLQLADNEMACAVGRREVLECDFHVLSTGCGNLRNTILTAASLPAEYQGKLHITLNDVEPSVMARNVLFLFILIREEGEEGLASSLATIWYSLHISKKDYKLLQRSLQDLLKINAERLQELVGGLVIISNADLDKIRDIWKLWYSLSCKRINRSSINLSQQRREWFAQQDRQFIHEFKFYQESLSETEAISVGQWLERGLFLPDDAKKSDLPYDNPTLTGPVLEESTVRDEFLSTITERKVMFKYCIGPSFTPFSAWDCNQVKQHAHTPSSSVIGMYHAYVVDLLQKAKALFTQGRLQIHLLVSSCLEVPDAHKTLGMVDYDRIFTSTLADRVGICKLLQIFRPLLNACNRNAVIVTETQDWLSLIPDALFKMDSNDKTMQLYRRDTGRQLSSPLAIRNQMEYRDNSEWFMVYLRAVMMAGGLDIPPIDDFLSFKQAMQHVEGLHMRDFRKELNKLVPFLSRINAKWLSLPLGINRALEWYIPQD